MDIVSDRGLVLSDLYVVFSPKGEEAARFDISEKGEGGLRKVFVGRSFKVEGQGRFGFQGYSRGIFMRRQASKKLSVLPMQVACSHPLDWAVNGNRDSISVLLKLNRSRARACRFLKPVLPGVLAYTAIP
jgi:hypothetical protein